MTTTKGIDFASITLRDALDLAILIEEEARDRYEEFADQMELHRTDEAAAFFRQMASNEEKHRAELAARRRSQFGDEPSGVGPSMIFDVEAPDYDEARAFMTVRQALDAALRCEQKAEAFFASVLGHVRDADVRALFVALEKEEKTHQQMVRHELEKAGEDPAFDADAFADEPVSQ